MPPKGPSMRAALCLVLVLAACGSTDTEIATERQTAYEAYVEELATTRCELGAMCCVGLRFSMTECMKPGVLDPGGEPDPGAFVFHPEIGEQCLADVRAMPLCSDELAMSSLPESCYRATTGLIAPGDACRADVECAPPVPTSLRGACNELSDGRKVCRQASALGEACDGTCTLTDRCYPFGYERPGICFTDLGTFCGRSGTCEPLGDEGGSCLDSEECASGLFCHGNTCLRRAAPGEPCPELSCTEGFYCNGDFVCAPKLAMGSPCDVVNACQQGVCTEADLCGASEPVCAFWGGD